MYLFGSGVMLATPLNDSLGNVITTPSPVELGVLQDGSIDVSFDSKMLYGSSQFPVAKGRGKGKITGKAKAARVNGALWNALFFGLPLVTGSQNIVFRDTTGTVVPASSPYTVTPTVPNSGTFLQDLGVTDQFANPLVCVTGTPLTGQYSVTGGVYTFAAADTGKTVLINYRYTATITGSSQLNVNNQVMGTVPSFSLDLSLPYNGKTLGLHLYSCSSNKMSLSTKQDDFVIPEFDFEASANDAGQVMQWNIQG